MNCDGVTGCYKHWIEIKTYSKCKDAARAQQPLKFVALSMSVWIKFVSSPLPVPSSWPWHYEVLQWCSLVHITKSKQLKRTFAGLVALDSGYLILGPYFYLLRMCFIITHSLQSVWRHDPHPINNTRRHFVVTGSHQARHHGITSFRPSFTHNPKSKGSVAKLFNFTVWYFKIDEPKFKPTPVLHRCQCDISNTSFSFSVRYKKIPTQQWCRTPIYSYQHPGYCILLISWSCHEGNTLLSSSHNIFIIYLLF